MSDTQKHPLLKHLEGQAYVSLLKHAEKCDTDIDYDWDKLSRDRRHAVNAALDLKDCIEHITKLEAENLQLREETTRRVAHALYALRPAR
jgi:hypothetical protein